MPLRVGEAVGRHEQAVDVGLRRLRERGERVVLRLAKGLARLREEASDRKDRLGQAAHLLVVRVPVGDLGGRLERVEPPTTDLVGARQHRDRVDRRRLRDLLVVEGGEEVDVGCVEVLHQVEDRVGSGLATFARREEVGGAGRRRARERRDPRGVDERDLPEGRRGPLDVEALDPFRREPAQLDVERLVDPAELRRAGLAVPRVDDDPVRDAVVVPGDDLRALTLVGRCERLADWSVRS